MTVHPWPQAQALAVHDLGTTRGLAVLSVAMPDQPTRAIARQRVRAALRETIAAWLKVPVAEVVLGANPGQPLLLQAPHHYVGVSVSHEAGISLAALHAHGSIGVDLMRVELVAPPDWELVAKDYLGATTYSELAQQPVSESAAAFASAWTAHEARLKCLGLRLIEWSPALEQAVTACTVSPLKLPPDLRGTVAVTVRLLPWAEPWQK
jgi:4'-phosphopantetheinyl transferase